ncbi:hypothetical protein OTB20_25080 [Streptomyces sp. H27-H1]|uniref:hypothetical protein n=1 Tax=Streptomyces sp. H27-H1 TaxID=2996461 RepID=UPI00226DF72C|nr:hypothetical protein [Streptomyces sp. H27-H1]MCY0929413.1 hypothetical protein [Streptomyces sp. H27-H1]
MLLEEAPTFHVRPAEAGDVFSPTENDANMERRYGPTDREPSTADELDRISELNGTSFTESMKTPAVVAAFADWSACMTGKGHPGFKDPFEAARSVTHPEGGRTRRPAGD